MRQQMPHRHRLRRRTRIQAPLDVDRNAQRPELGQDVRHWLIEGEPAVFDEQHRRDAGSWSPAGEGCSSRRLKSCSPERGPRVSGS